MDKFNYMLIIYVGYIKIKINIFFYVINNFRRLLVSKRKYKYFKIFFFNIFKCIF